MQSTQLPWNKRDPDLARDSEEALGLASSVLIKLVAENASDSHLVGDLKELASLSLGLLTNFSPGSSSKSDELDRAGVEIWNQSILLRQATENVPPTVVAFARRAACLLLDAGSPRPLADQNLLKMLMTFTKALQILVELGDVKSGEILLERAAELESLAIKLDGSIEKTVALQKYWLTRSSIESCKNNQVLKEFFLNKSVGDFVESPSDVTTVGLRIEIAKSCLQYGTDLLKQGKESSSKSVKWLQTGIKLLERMETFSTPTVTGMLAKALRKLARACLLASDEDSSESLLASAETSIKEYSKIRKSRKESTSDTSLDFLRFEISSRRNRTEEELSSNFDRICSGMELNQRNINKALHLLRSNSNRSKFYSNGNKSLLNATLNQAGHDFVCAVLLNFTFSIKSRQDLDTFDSMLGTVSSDISYELPADGVFACQAALWKSAQHHCDREEWEKASNYFALSIHQAFENSTNTNLAKGFRKIAFCFLQNGKPETALRHLRAIPARCPSSATTWHLEFIAHIRMGSEDSAMNVLDKLVRASDFQGSMLLSVIKELETSGHSELLLKSLSHLAKRVDVEPNLMGEINAISLNRSIVKMSIPEGSDLSALDADSLSSLLSALKLASEILETAPITARNGKESVWMSRTAYNLALKNLESVDLPIIVQLFSAALALLQISERLTQDSSTEVKEMKVWSKVIAIVASFANAREIDNSEARLKLFSGLRPDVEQAKQLFSELAVTPGDEKFELTFTLTLLEWEALLEVGDWKDLHAKTLALQADPVSLPLVLWEQLTDMIWKKKDAPEELVIELLQSTIHSLSFSEDAASISRLSGWQRTLISYMIRKDSVEANQEALRLFSECILTLNRCSSSPSLKDAYPSDEIQWLLSQAWDRGVQLFNVNRAKEAKKFCEAALSISSFTGRKNEESLRRNYQEYLSHFTDEVDQDEEMTSSPST